ncbi:YidB family protein, partial [Rhizobium johnstonii]
YWQRSRRERPDLVLPRAGLLGGLAGSGGLGGLIGGLTSGGIVSGGLGDLLKTFQQNGQGDKAESWVQPGPNADIDEG